MVRVENASLGWLKGASFALGGELAGQQEEGFCRFWDVFSSARRLKGVSLGLEEQSSVWSEYGRIWLPDVAPEILLFPCHSSA